MSIENPFNAQENAPEHFPSQEELKTIFEGILEGQEYKELKIKKEGEEVIFYEIEVTLENGEKMEYNYQKADSADSAKFKASIHVTYYDSEGMPFYGEDIANYRDGKWEYSS